MNKQHQQPADDPRDDAYFVAQGFILKPCGGLCPSAYPNGAPFTIDELRRHEDAANRIAIAKRGKRSRRR